jgi:nucleotide-binding universal stress UspA family protein
VNAPDGVPEYAFGPRKRGGKAPIRDFAGTRPVAGRTATDSKAPLTWPFSTLSEAVRDHPQVDVHRQTVEGPAQKVLLEASADADLLVVGAMRRQGHFGLQLGCTAHALLHHSECPVAVVPQRA